MGAKGEEGSMRIGGEENNEQREIERERRDGR